VIPVIYQTRPADFTSLEAHAQTDWDDLGILRLAQPIPQGYTPATIMNANEELQAGTPILLAGYGIDVPVEPTSPADTAGAGVLREVDQTIINPNYGQTEVLVSLQGKGACHGDSGGPAYVNEGGHLALFGVTSRLTNDDISGNVMSCSVDMVYTDILKRATWINAAVQKLEGLQAPPTPQEQAPEQIGGTTTKRGRHIPRG
jgi:secreted trypsin-like serine protease